MDATLANYFPDSTQRSTKAAFMSSRTSSDTAGAMPPTPKSLRLIVAVPRKPKLALLFIGSMPSPTTMASIVTGLVRSLIVRFPTIVAVFPVPA
jgi:hypothetical protein